MAGPFSEANRPREPGAFFNWDPTDEVVLSPSVGRTVAVPFVSDWGPVEEAVGLNSFGDYLQIFGDSSDTDGYAAVKQAFQGEGLPGRSGGAGRVVAFRQAGASAAKADVDLNNTTPAAALTLTAKYEGSKGNDLRVTVQNLASDATKDELLILLGTQVLERYQYTDANITDLAAQINASSQWVTATATVSGTALAPVASTALSGGDDGATLLAADWTALMDALDTQRFGYLAAYNLTDSTILASLAAWVTGLNESRLRFIAVVGGAADEDVATAVSRSATLNSPYIVNVGVGHVEDDDLGTLSPAKFTPRIAGLMAARGEALSMTYARIGGVTLANAANKQGLLDAYDGGVTVLSRDAFADAPVRVERAVTTYTTKTDADRPYDVYKEPRYLTIMGGIEMEFVEYAEQNWIGRTRVNDKTRDAARAWVRERLQARQEAEIVQPGWSVEIDQNPPPSDDDSFIALVFGMRFGRTTEQVFFTAKAA